MKIRKDHKEDIGEASPPAREPAGFSYGSGSGRDESFLVAGKIRVNSLVIWYKIK